MQILQTTSDNLVYISAARLAPLYLMGWIYCLVPKLATKTVCPRFSTVSCDVLARHNCFVSACRDAACVLVSAEARALMEQVLASEADNQQMSARVAALLAGSSLTTKQGVRLPGEPRQVDMVQYDGGTYPAPATPHRMLYYIS